MTVRRGLLLTISFSMLIAMLPPAQIATAKQKLKAASVLTVPAGFIDEMVIDGLARPRAFAFAPDGRIFVAETGSASSQDINLASIRVFKNNQLLPQRALTLEVCGDGERGMLGLALDPGFASNGLLYVYYTRKSPTPQGCGYTTYQNNQPGPRNRVSRFQMIGDEIDPSSERVLIDTLAADTGIHNAGDMHFGPDGYLYIATGESGISALAQPLNNPNGKMLRIKPSTGEAGGYGTAGNPFDTAPGAQMCGTAASFGPGPCREVYAYGFRNPFRFAIQAGGDNIFIGDVGGGAWEEVSRLVAGGNYGWPLREGPCSPGNQCAWPPLTPSGYEDPIYAYSHVVNGSRIDSAVTAGAFIPPHASYPAEYLGNYMLADAVRGFMRRLAFDAQTSTWEPVQPDFSTDAFGVISMQAGPDGNLYYLFIDGTDGRTNMLRRIRYALAENARPVARVSATPAFSTQIDALFTFSAAGSSDPDANLPLSYTWSFGDGITATTSALTVTHRYSSAGAKTVSLTVTDNGTPPATSLPATVNVFPGNTPPTATLVLANVTAPARDLYHAGDVWAYSAVNITDDLPLPADALSWAVVFHHEDHTHPFLSNLAGTNGQFTIPAQGETSPVVWYRVELKITDASGLTTLVYRDVFPETTTVTLNSMPPGAQLQIDSEARAAPFTVTRVVGLITPVSVISSTLAMPEGTWTFAEWSNAGTAAQEIVVSPKQVLTATYTLNAPPATPPPATPPPATPPTATPPTATPPPATSYRLLFPTFWR